MANTPSIRFKGFEDEWEQRKFSDFTWASGKRNKEDLDLEPYAITNEHGFIPQNEAHDDFGYMKGTDRKAYNIVTPNSFAYNPARINVGSIGYYEGTENVIVSSLYEVFQTVDYVDDRFLWHWFKSDEFPKWIERLQEGSVRLYFYYDKLCECQMFIPSVTEQTKIAILLDHLDHLITLHQRKYDEMKQLKKFMLQKMFPKSGELIPEIRFVGFTGEWEQRKLGEIVSIGSGMDYKGLGEGDIPVYGTGGYMLSVDKALSYDKDAVGIGRKGTIDKPYILKAPFWTVDTLFYCIPKEDFDLDFVYSVFQNINWKQKDESTGVPSLSKVIISSTEITITSMEEQQKIGVYFSNLDHLITLHQHKCDELQGIKKFMLQNMFV